MKIFLLSKRGLMVYTSLFVLAICMIFTGGEKTADVSTLPAEKRLPIYSTNVGEEKICALTFDAAWDDSDTDRLIKILDEKEKRLNILGYRTSKKKKKKK